MVPGTRRSRLPVPDTVRWMILSTDFSTGSAKAVNQRRPILGSEKKQPVLCRLNGLFSLRITGGFEHEITSAHSIPVDNRIAQSRPTRAALTSRRAFVDLGHSCPGVGNHWQRSTGEMAKPSPQARGRASIHRSACWYLGGYACGGSQLCFANHCKGGRTLGRHDTCAEPQPDVRPMPRQMPRSEPVPRL